MSIQELKDKIIQCGLDNKKFGENVGGYHIQQDPNELAALVNCLKHFNDSVPINSYLSIGIAAGGTDRFICEEIGVNHFICIDEGTHEKRVWWEKENKPALSCKIDEFTGDSHSEEATQFLSNCNIQYDLIGIDGDHTPCGVRLDWMLIEPYLKTGTLVWLHDINFCQGPMEFWNNLSKKFKPVFESKESFGIGMVKI